MLGYWPKRREYSHLSVSRNLTRHMRIVAAGEAGRFSGYMPLGFYPAYVWCLLSQPKGGRVDAMLVIGMRVAVRNPIAGNIFSTSTKWDWVEVPFDPPLRRRERATPEAYDLYRDLISSAMVFYGLEKTG